MCYPCQFCLLIYWNFWHYHLCHCLTFSLICDCLCCFQVPEPPEGQNVIQQLPQRLRQPQQLAVQSAKLWASWHRWPGPNWFQAEEPKSEYCRSLTVDNGFFLQIFIILFATENTTWKWEKLKKCSPTQNLLSDIARKESDLNNVSKNAQLYQQAVKVRLIVWTSTWYR